MEELTQKFFSERAYPALMYLLAKLSKAGELEIMLPEIKVEKIENGKDESMGNLKMKICRAPDSKYELYIIDTKTSVQAKLTSRRRTTFGQYYQASQRGFFSLEQKIPIEDYFLGLEFKGEPKKTKVLAYTVAYLLWETNDNWFSKEIAKEYGI